MLRSILAKPKSEGKPILQEWLELVLSYLLLTHGLQLLLDLGVLTPFCRRLSLSSKKVTYNCKFRYSIPSSPMAGEQKF